MFKLCGHGALDAAEPDAFSFSVGTPLSQLRQEVTHLPLRAALAVRGTKGGDAQHLACEVRQRRLFSDTRVAGDLDKSNTGAAGSAYLLLRAQP